MKKRVFSGRLATARLSIDNKSEAVDTFRYGAILKTNLTFSESLLKYVQTEKAAQPMLSDTL